MRLGQKVKRIYDSNLKLEDKEQELYKLGFNEIETYYILFGGKDNEYRNENK